MDKNTLRRKMDALAAYPGINKDAAQRFGKVIQDLSGWELFRINPYAFADKHGFGRTEAVDIFIHGVKVGLFDFEWNLLCPLCGNIVNSHEAIGDIDETHFHCVTCDVNFVTDLSDYVEVSFSIAPDICRLDLDPFSSFTNYFKSYNTANYSAPALFMEYFTKHYIRDFAIAGPGQSAKIEFTPSHGQVYRLISVDANSMLGIKISEKDQDLPQIIDIDLVPSGFTPETLVLPAGRVTLHVKNNLNRKTGLELIHSDEKEMTKYFEKAPPKMKEFFLGKHLLNNQSYRDLFRNQGLPLDLRLKVSNITILFTDLTKSTELYDRIGDMHAYGIVQEHFDLLKESARANSGAIVKTIGDAVMASFSSPRDGLYAASDMNRRIGEAARKWHASARDMTIKVGLHTGTTLAVSANETLDYFGHTVNVAARVQGLAEGGEIWITDDVYKSEGVRDVLQTSRYAIKKQSALLKGVKEAMTVYQCQAG